MTAATEVALAVTAIGGALALLYAGWRRVRRFVLEGRKDARAFKDAILGRDEIIHPETGVILAPAVPGIGARMATIETAVVEMASTHARVDRLEVRVANLEEKELERAQARTESIELMRTIEAAIRANPPGETP